MPREERKSPTLSELPELCKVSEVASYARCSSDTVYSAIASGQLSPVARFGRVLRVPRPSIARWAGGENK